MPSRKGARRRYCPRPDFDLFPASRTRRASYLSDLIEQGANLALHGGTAFTLALDLPLSAVRDFYESSAFTSYRKGQEAQQKLTIAVLGRIDNVVRAIGNLGKALAGRR